MTIRHVFGVGRHVHPDIASPTYVFPTLAFPLFVGYISSTMRDVAPNNDILVLFRGIYFFIVHFLDSYVLVFIPFFHLGHSIRGSSFVYLCLGRERV